jgi:hypothetical protein
VGRVFAHDGIVPVGNDDHGFVFHGGQMPGYSSAVAFDPGRRVGVVVLSNSTNDDGGIAWHILRPPFPLTTSASVQSHAEQLRRDVTVDQPTLDRLLGYYKPQTGSGVTIERRGNTLVMISDDTPTTVTLHAASDREFFVAGSDLRLTFELDASGRASAVVFHFAGVDTRAPHG